MKRIPVDLRDANRPILIGKDEEKLGEIINIAATVERLIDAITWIDHQPTNDGWSILECHPSTSDESLGNDLVVGDRDRRVVIRCEVCDVASTNAGSNGKEKSDLESLGCETHVPNDGILRYICTSAEFANALASPRRNWQTKEAKGGKRAKKGKHYRYSSIPTGFSTTTMLLLSSPQTHLPLVDVLERSLERSTQGGVRLISP